MVDQSVTPFDAPAGLIPQWGSSSQMFTLSQQLVAQSETYLDDLLRLSNSISYPAITPAFPVAAGAPAPVTVPLPALETVAWTVPTQPAAFNGGLDIDGLLPGPLQAQQPTLNFGSAPAPFSGTAPQAPAIDLNFDYPSVDVMLPTPPSLMTLDTVAFNPFNIPTFDVTVPTLTIATPNIVPYVEGSGYTSALLTSLQTSLDDAITNGAYTSLSAQAQQALWDAGREREYRSQADALAELERMEELGYAFPPGVFVDARIKLQTETQNTVAGLSREIMFKQADTQLQNIVAAREEAVNLEAKFIDYQNQVNQRALETAKYVTDAAVAIYNGQVQKYTAQIEGYRVQAEVYDTQIKGIQAQIAQLQAQIEFEKVKADINTSLVEQYKVQVDAALATIDIFKGEIEIIQTQAQIEKIKIDAFAAQIQAYVGTINAYTAQVEAYKAQVQTQGVIEDVYKTQVDAYGVQVDAGIKAADAVIQQYKGRIEAYEAQLEGYKANLQAMVEQARAAAEYNTSASEVYRATVEATSAYNQTLTAQWQAVLNEQVAITETTVKAAEASGQLAIAAQSLAIEATKGAAQVTAQLGAAALNAIHWSNSSSWSLSSSSSSSVSNSTSTSDDHVYSESA